MAVLWICLFGKLLFASVLLATDLLVVCFWVAWY